MFIPAFVLGVFIYSFIDVYYQNRKITAFWQIIQNKVNLCVVWGHKRPFSFIKIAYINEDNNIKYLCPNESLMINTKSNNGSFLVIIQGRLDVFRRVILLEKCPTPSLNIKNSEYIEENRHDIYFEIKPYKEGDRLSRIDALQTVKRNQIYVRHELVDIINKKIKYKVLKTVSIFIRSDLYIKKRNDLVKGPIFEWLLIITALTGIQLEWNNIVFSVISIFLIIYIYIFNVKMKKKLYSKKMMNYWVIALFLLVIFESIITKDMIEAGVHFLLLLCIIKHRFERERRDSFTYIFLVLFIIVALSFFTLKVWFILLFLSYLLISIALFSIYAGGEKKEEYEVNIGRPKNKLSYIAMNISIIALTFGLFFVIPHGQGIKTHTGQYIKPNIAKTGFSEKVDLTQILSIKKDYSKQFLIENIKPENTPQYEKLYWRGMRFSFFEDGKWERFDNNWINYTPIGKKLPSSKEWNINYFPADYDAVFLPTTPISISGDKFSQMGYDRSIAKFANKILKVTPVTINIPYEGTKIKRLPSSFDQFVFNVNPETTKLLQPFWNSIPKDILNDPFKISNYIKNEAGFNYSLDKTAKNLNSFLYDEKQGHCEYFATVLALTLQNLNYPITLVNGFKGGEYNSLSETWIIRGQNAHAWVEILNKDKQWIVLDPTPDIETELWVEQNAIIQNIIKYYDTIEYKWYKYIVNFDNKQQYKLWNKIIGQKNIIIFITISFIIIYGLNILYKKSIIPYIRLSNKEKFMLWLSNKLKSNYFVLENIHDKYPKLVKTTRDIIYGDMNIMDLKSLRKEWSKKINK